MAELSPELAEALAANPEALESILEPEAAEAEEEFATDPDQYLPGTEEGRTLELSGDQQREIGKHLCQLLDEHDQAMDRRWRRLDQVADNYDMEVDDETTGIQPNGARACSELTKSQVDQAKARLAAMMMGTKPLAKISAAVPEGGDPAAMEDLEMAEAAEDFLERYSRQVINTPKMLPLKLLAAAKFDCAATRDMWEEKTKTYRYRVSKDTVRERTTTTGQIVCRLIHYRDLLLWPLQIDDWQDAEIAGHRARYSEWRFREICEDDYGMEGPEVDAMLAGATAETEDDQERLKRKEVDTSGTEELDRRFQLTEIWFHGKPKGLEPGKYQFILHEKSQTLCHWDYNPLHCQWHPYMEFVYKPTEFWALGEGVGRELLPAHKASSSLLNLEIDNLKVSGNDVILVSDESGADTIVDNLYPGRRVVVHGPAKDALHPVRLGGSLDHIHEVQDRWERRATATTGLSSVLQGRGDPTMKSGADASSTLGLIEEGGKKFGDVDQSIKTCYSREVLFWLLLLQQYAPNGFSHDLLPIDKATALERIKWMPPGGDLQNKFRVIAQAPSAASNREAQKQRLLIFKQIADQHMLDLERMGTEVYQQEGMIHLVNELKRQIATFKNKLLVMLLEYQEIDGLTPDVPQLEDPQEIDQVMAQMFQELQNLQQEVESLTAQNEAMNLIAQGADPALAEAVAQGGGGGGIPQGGPQPGMG